jgi:hypothetical protein
VRAEQLTGVHESDAAMIFLFLVFVAFVVLWVVGWLESRDDGL